jgi:RNA polymerase-binding transcription factor DksA
MKAQELNALRVPPQWRGHFKELQTLRKGLLKNRENQTSRFSTGMIGRSIVLGILAQDPDALSEVDAAIARILDGSYGICQKTGQPIPESRLRVVPWTRFTKEALEDTERGKMAERLPRNSVAWLAPA